MIIFVIAGFSISSKSNCLNAASSSKIRYVLFNGSDDRVFPLSGSAHSEHNSEKQGKSSLK